MRLKLPQALTAAAARAGREAAFRVVIVYDDFAAGKRAMDTCNFLMLQLGGEARIISSMWKFDVLRCAKLSQMAVADALEADVIIVANGQDSGLPAEVLDWLKRWTPCRHRGSAALVALMDYTGDDLREPARAHALLKQAAATAGIDFLSQEIHCGDSEEPIRPNPITRESSGQHQDPLQDRPLADGWGINE